MPSFLDAYVPYLLERASELISARFHAELLAEGIEISEWRILAVLLDASPQPVTELMERTMLPQPTVSHVLARLESRGCVVRRPGAADRRQRLADLTGEGRRLAKRLVRRASHLERAALAMVDPILSDRLLDDVAVMLRSLETTTE